MSYLNKLLFALLALCIPAGACLAIDYDVDRREVLFILPTNVPSDQSIVLKNNKIGKSIEVRWQIDEDPNEIFSVKGSQQLRIFSVPAGGTTRVTIECWSTTDGPKSAWLRLFHENDTISVRLMRVMPQDDQKKIRVTPDLLDFETVPVSSVGVADFKRIFTIHNEGDRPVEYLLHRFDNKNQDVFAIAGTTPILVHPRDSIHVAVILKVPTSSIPLPGQKFSTLRLYTLNRKDSISVEAVVVLKEPVPDVLQIPDLEAASGTQFDLPVIIARQTRERDVARVGLVISFNASVMTPANPAQRGVIMNGSHQIELNIPFEEWSNGDTILKIPMIAMLGDAEYSKVSFEAAYIAFNGRPLPKRVDPEDAVFKLTDVFKNVGVPRLINASIGTLKMETTPSTVTTTSTAAITYFGTPQLKIYNLLGTEIADLSNLVEPAQQGQSKVATVPIDKSLFQSNGMYLVRLTSGGAAVTRMIAVE